MTEKTFTLRQWIRARAREYLHSKQLINAVVKEAVRQRKADSTASVEEILRRSMVGIAVDSPQATQKPPATASSAPLSHSET